MNAFSNQYPRPLQPRLFLFPRFQEECLLGHLSTVHSGNHLRQQPVLEDPVNLPMHPVLVIMDSLFHRLRAHTIRHLKIDLKLGEDGRVLKTIMARASRRLPCILTRILAGGLRRLRRVARLLRTSILEAENTIPGGHLRHSETAQGGIRPRLAVPARERTR